MKYRSTLILFMVAVFMGGVYLFYIRPHTEEKKMIEDFEKRFFRADTADIEFLRIDTGQGPITIHKSGSSWKITKPAEYTPDRGAIESLFKALAKGRLIKIVGDADDLDEFGFKTVHILLSLGYRGTIDVLKIAGESPSAAGHYAFSERLGKIFLVDKEFVTAMNLKPIDLREKRLFIFEPEEIGRIQLQRPLDTVELKKRSDGWHMLLPLPIRADSADVEILIETLHTQKAEAFLKWIPELGNLQNKIHLELQDIRGGPLGSYNIYFWGTEWDKGIIAHRPDSEEAMRVRRDFWILLEREYSQFGFRNMITIDQSAAQIIRLFSGNDTYVFRQTDGVWRSDRTSLSEPKVLELINTLNTWKAEKLVLESRELGREQFVVEVEYQDRTQRAVVTNFNMDYEISRTALFGARKGVVKKEKIDFFYARSSDLESSAIVSYIDIQNILDIVRDRRDE